MCQGPEIRLILAALLLAFLQGSVRPSPGPGYLSAYVWQMPDRGFGGFSALQISDHGLGLVAISDRGHAAEGRITRDDQGRITAIDATLTALADDGGRSMTKGRSDAEGIAVTADGRIYIAFERHSRVMSYSTLSGPAAELPGAEAFRTLQRNASFEALAIDVDDTIYIVLERSDAADLPFPVYRFRDGHWDQPFVLPRTGHFLAVSADMGPDGRFYLLERAFYGPAGFASRVRVFTLGAGGFGPSETLIETPPGLHDNLEGLSVWRDDAGTIRLTMIADNNFMPFLHSEIVKYRLPD
jgi:hypothetical protein